MEAPGERASSGDSGAVWTVQVVRVMAEEQEVAAGEAAEE